MSKKGKYARVIRELPAYQNEDASFQEAVTATRAHIITSAREQNIPLTSAILARKVFELRRKKAEAEQAVREANLILEAYSGLLNDQFEADDITRVVFEDGTSVSIQHEPYARIVDRQQLVQWAFSQNLQALLTLPWQTVNAMTKEALLHGQPAPPGVQTYDKFKVVVRNLGNEGMNE